jgi:hypothetical protein
LEGKRSGEVVNVWIFLRGCNFYVVFGINYPAIQLFNFSRLAPAITFL